MPCHLGGFSGLFLCVCPCLYIHTLILKDWINTSHQGRFMSSRIFSLHLTFYFPPPLEKKQKMKQGLFIYFKVKGDNSGIRFAFDHDSALKPESTLVGFLFVCLFLKSLNKIKMLKALNSRILKEASTSKLKLNWPTLGNNRRKIHYCFQFNIDSCYFLFWFPQIVFCYIFAIFYVFLYSECTVLLCQDQNLKFF